jgi:hypothetical protein
MDAITCICNQISAAINRYGDHHDESVLTRDFIKLATEYCEYTFIGEFLLQVATQQFENGNQTIGFALIYAIYHGGLKVDNTVTFYLRMAQFWMLKGEEALAKEQLINLCTKTFDNYEEAVAARNLTDVWESYKHLVIESVLPSVFVMGVKPLPRNQCSMAIMDILGLSDADLPEAMSEHLNELSANGESLSSLNRWEKTVYEIDLMMMEVNSGGFDSYLRYNGTHFERLKKAISAVEAHETENLLQAVEQKFPKKKIPKSYRAIENALDILDERCMDFDAEDEWYYNTAERELIAQVTLYIRDHAERFR